MHKLPITLKVRALERSALALTAQCVLTDAAGTSVSSAPITMGPKTGTAEVVAILQAHVDDVAKKMHERGEAELDQTPETAEDFNALVGRTFQGSVAT